MNKSNQHRYFITIIIMLLAIIPISVFSVKGQISELPEYFTWITKTSMPTSRYGFGLAVVDNKIFAIGGIASDGRTPHATNEVYNPQTDTWETKTPIPTIRSSKFAITTYQNKIYCIGGKNTYANEVYDPATDTWTTKAPLQSQYHRSPNAHTVNDKIYLISGQTDEFDFWPSNSPEVNIYDPKTDTWTQGEPIPTPVTKYASAVVNDKIYVFGGTDYLTRPIEVYGLTQIYDPATNTWSSGTPMLEKRYDCVATVGSGPWGIYVLGGVLNDTASYITQIYDPIKNSWNYGTTFPQFESGVSLEFFLSYPSGVVTVDDHMYAISGTHTLKHVIVGSETPSPSSTPISGPDPTPTPSIEPTSKPPNNGPTSSPTTPTQIETILGASIVILVLGAGFGFLVYLMKKK